MVVFWKFYCWQ